MHRSWWIGVAASISTVVSGFPLTIKVPANEVECFYGEVQTIGAKVGFSFAVQAGGQFDIDLVIKGPDGQVIYNQPKESQGEFGFAATQVGEHQFCFSNDMSTFSDKVVEFDLNIDSEVRAQLPPSVGQGDTDALESSIDTMERRASELHRSIGHYRTRNKRNESTVKSTENRIFYFSVIEVILMVGMGILQVTIVQLFFAGARKQLV
jgi:hypothetical protein